MSSTIVPPASFDVSKVTFAAPKILDSGAKQVYLSYDGRPLMTQTASMALPYGLNVYDKAGPTTYSFDLSFRGMEENPKVQSFNDMLTALDEFMIEAGVQNSQAWFKKANLSREVIKEFYTPSIKIALDRDGKPKPYPPTFKVKLPKKNGAFEAQFYNAQSQPYEGVVVDDLLVKGARSTVLLKCTGVWFAGTKYGVSWKAVQVKMNDVPERVGRSCAILDDDEAPAAPARRAAASAPANRFSPVEDSEEDEDVVEAVMPSKSKAPVAAAAVAEDSEEEEDEDDVVEAPVVPKKATSAAPKKAPRRAAK